MRDYCLENALGNPNGLNDQHVRSAVVSLQHTRLGCLPQHINGYPFRMTKYNIIKSPPRHFNRKTHLSGVFESSCRTARMPHSLLRSYSLLAKNSSDTFVYHMASRHLGMLATPIWAMSSSPALNVVSAGTKCR